MERHIVVFVLSTEGRLPDPHDVDGIIKRLLGCVFLAEIDADGVGELLLCLAVKGVASVLVGLSGIGVEGTAEINELVLWRHINTAGVEHVKLKVEVPADDALGIAEDRENTLFPEHIKNIVSNSKKWQI